jgi:hypothetical protein
VPISGHVGGLGAIQHREFAMAAGEMSQAEFTNFLGSVFSHLVAYSADGAIHFQCMDWRHVGEVLAAGSACYAELKNICVWAKNNGGMGSLYRSQHEFVFVFKSGIAPHINNLSWANMGAIAPTSGIIPALTVLAAIARTCPASHRKSR